MIPLIFLKVPQAFLGILRVPHLPSPLEHPPLKNPTNQEYSDLNEFFSILETQNPPVLYMDGSGDFNNHFLFLEIWFIIQLKQNNIIYITCN